MPCGNVVQFPKILHTANLLVNKELQYPIDIVLKRTDKSIESYHSNNLNQSLLQAKSC